VSTLLGEGEDNTIRCAMQVSARRSGVIDLMHVLMSLVRNSGDPAFSRATIRGETGFEQWKPQGKPKDSAGIVGAPNKINPQHLELVTSHPDAHSIARHGGAVTDHQLQRSALTGVAPDGHVKVKTNGQVILPSLSSAFHSDELLVAADQTVRNSAAFQRKVTELLPGETFITVKAGDIGGLGLDLGR
jgi:hypothetical protein